MTYEKSFLKTKKSLSKLFVCIICVLLIGITFFVCYSPTYAKYLVNISVENTTTFDFVGIENGGSFYTAERSGRVASVDVYHLPSWKSLTGQKSILLCFNNYSNKSYDIEIETTIRTESGIIPESEAIYVGVYLEDSEGNRVLYGVKKLMYFHAWGNVYDYYCGDDSATTSGHTSNAFVTSKNGSALINSNSYQNVFIQFLQKNSDNTYSIYNYSDVCSTTTIVSFKVYAKLH